MSHLKTKPHLPALPARFPVLCPTWRPNPVYLLYLHVSLSCAPPVHQTQPTCSTCTFPCPVFHLYTKPSLLFYLHNASLSCVPPLDQTLSTCFTSRLPCPVSHLQTKLCLPALHPGFPVLCPTCRPNPIYLLYLNNVFLCCVPPEDQTQSTCFTSTRFPCLVSHPQTKPHPTCSSFSASWALRWSASARALSRHSSLFVMVAWSSVTLASSSHTAVS